MTMTRARLPRRARVVLWASAAALAGVAATLVGSNAWVALASRDQRFAAADAPSRPVALVLGAGVYPDGTPQPFLAARLDLAAELLRTGKVAMLLLSGDNSAAHYDEPTSMRRYLLARGVPADRMVLDYAGLDTYDSCVRARRIFGVDSVTVVSQDYHLPRALATCRAIGLDAIGVGDTTMRHLAPAVWAQGRTREIPAAVKAVWDVLSRRDPILGAPEPALRTRLSELDTDPPEGGRR